jgi:hypothetical protein
MSAVEEIEKAIDKLPQEEFWDLTNRLIQRANDAWDQQLVTDVQSGRLDHLVLEAKAEITRGETVPLDEFLRNE